MPPEEIIDKIRWADVVVGHAGVGTVLVCLNQGKIPVVFPRRKEFGEHVDNHQIDFCMALMKENLIPVAWDEQELVDMILAYKSLETRFRVRRDRENQNRLIRFLKQELNQTEPRI